MWCKKSFFVVSFIVSMLVMSVCSAQTFYSADKRASLVAPDEYVLATENDGETIIKIQNNHRNIAIAFTISKDSVGYRTLKDVPAEVREKMKDAIQDSLISNMKSMGYDVSVSPPECDENLFMIGLKCTKNNKSFLLSKTSFIKENYLFILSIWAPLGGKDVDDALGIMETLTVDGIPIGDWIP